MFSNYVILLTGSIIPSPKAKIVITSPEVRLRQYCEAIRFWSSLGGTRNRIIFFDNSGYGAQNINNKLSSLQLPHINSVDIISHAMNTIPEGFHYGYAELSILDFALKNIPKIKKSKYFIKASGRLTFPTIEKLIEKLPNDYLFAVDARYNNLFVKSPQRFITTQLMIFRTQFYLDNLIGINREMEQYDNLLEKLFFEKLITYKTHPDAILRWPVSVDPVGYAAHWKKCYHSRPRKIINIARSALRTFAPEWWV